MCLNHKLKKKKSLSAGSFGLVDRVFKSEDIQIDHVFKPSLV